MVSSKEKILLDRAVKAVKRGDKREAVSLFKGVVNLNPTNVQAWLGLAWALDKEREKRFCLRRVLEIDPNNRYAIKMLQSLEEKDKSIPNISGRVNNYLAEEHSRSVNVGRDMHRGVIVTGNHNKVENLQEAVTCFYHPQEPAVGQCPRCGKFLCKRCTEGLGGLCVDCGAGVVEEEKERLKKDIIKTFMPIVIFALIGAVLGAVIGYNQYESLGERIFNTLLFAYMFAGVPIGWKGVGLVFKGVKATSFEGLYWLYAIRFMVALIVGLFLQPFVSGYLIIKFWRRFKALSRQKQRVQQVQMMLSQRFGKA